MVDRNSLFSKSSQLSKEMLVSTLLKMNKNFDSRSKEDLQQQLSDEYKSLRSNERMSNGVVSQLLRSLHNPNNSEKVKNHSNQNDQKTLSGADEDGDRIKKAGERQQKTEQSEPNAEQNNLAIIT